MFTEARVFLGDRAKVICPVSVKVCALHRENRENGPKKHRELGNFAKTQGIWFTQVINSLILKVKDISKFAVKISRIFFKLDKSANLVLCM